MPSRRSLQLWDTPEISQFRGYQGSLDESEARWHTAQVEQLDLRQAAREARSAEMPNMEIIGEKLTQQRQSTAAIAAHVQNLAEQNCRETAGMAAEHRAELERFANAHAESQNRQRIAESALAGLRKAALEQRNRIAELAA